LQIKELKIVKDSNAEWIVLVKTEHVSSNKKASKVLAEHLLEQYRGISTSIHYTDKGKPYLINRSEFISISHTHQWFCLMLSTSHACGIDIEHPREALYRIAPRFLHSSEMRFVEQNKDSLSALHYIWGAKEAVYKSWGLRGLEFATDMIVRPFEAAPPCAMVMDFNFNQQRRVYQLYALHINDLYLVHTDGFDVVEASI